MKTPKPVHFEGARHGTDIRNSYLAQIGLEPQPKLPFFLPGALQSTDYHDMLA
jgi:hypothetical protein